MFSKKPNYPKLRSNLRLCIQRLKLLEKKKTELALKARKEIADYIQAGKDDRARIRVEHIVREDFMVEAMEILEMFCDLLVARFGMIEKMHEMDPSLQEAIASIIWAAPRLMSDVPELKVVSMNFQIKYGKEWHQTCLAPVTCNELVNDKLQKKMSIFAPPKHLIEMYMVEISKAYNVPFEPDPILMGTLEECPFTNDLINIDGSDRNGGGGDGGMPGMPMPLIPNPLLPPYPQQQATYPQQAPYPQQQVPYPQQAPYPQQPMGYPPSTGYLGGMDEVGGTNGASALPSKHEMDQGDGAMKYPLPPGASGTPSAPPSTPPGGATHGSAPDTTPPPAYTPLPPYGSTNQNPANTNLTPSPPFPSPPGGTTLPDLPSVPSSLLNGPPNEDEVDFDDLTRRFEDLKKKK